ncbi:MAG: hypothetical protein ABR926_19535, partial [Streptosporangiaceae bacterium]
ASKHHPRRRSDDGLDGLGDIGNRETDKNGDTHGDTTQGGLAALLGVMWVAVRRCNSTLYFDVLGSTCSAKPRQLTCPKARG